MAHRERVVDLALVFSTWQFSAPSLSLNLKYLLLLRLLINTTMSPNCTLVFNRSVNQLLCFIFSSLPYPNALSTPNSPNFFDHLLCNHIQLDSFIGHSEKLHELRPHIR